MIRTTNLSKKVISVLFPVCASAAYLGATAAYPGAAAAYLSVAAAYLGAAAAYLAHSENNAKLSSTLPI